MKFPVYSNAAADMLIREAHGSDPEANGFSRLINTGEPINHRLAVQTTPATMNYFSGAPGGITTTLSGSAGPGNYHSDSKLGDFYGVITAVKFIHCGFTLEDHLVLLALAAKGYVTINVNDLTWFKAVPLHHFLDGIHMTTTFNTTAAAGEENQLIGGPGEGYFPCQIPYKPLEKIEVRLEWAATFTPAAAVPLECNLQVIRKAHSTMAR